MREGFTHVNNVMLTYMHVVGRRTDWFRAWAAKKRTDEEVNLLYADGRASRRGFQFASSLWDVASDNVGLSQGARAYAAQKSKMFRGMALEVETAVISAHLHHTEIMQDLRNDDEDEGLSKVYQYTQAGLSPSDDKLDYSLVSGTSAL